MNNTIIGHHRVGRVRKGSDEPCNIMRVDRKEEQKMHAHEGVRVFHEKLIHAMEWDGPVLIPEIKAKLLGLIQEFGPEMYEKPAFKNWERDACWMFDKKRGLYIPKPYDQKRYAG